MCRRATDAVSCCQLTLVSWPSSAGLRQLTLASCFHSVVLRSISLPPRISKSVARPVAIL